MAADVDGDADLDLIAAAYDAGAVGWYENDGSQSFTEHIISAAATQVYRVVAAPPRVVNQTC